MVPSPPLQPDGPNTVLIFGSQALDFNQETADQLRSILLTNPALQWTHQVIANLPQKWEQVSQAIPELQDFQENAKSLLNQLNEWLKTGEHLAFPLPNTVLTPLVVLVHLAQWTIFTSDEYAAPSRFPILASQQLAETLGLCTGILSAAAISASANDAQLRRYGAVALCLAMAIGAVVDANDSRDTKVDSDAAWKSFSAAWTSAELEETMTRLMQDFPEVRIISFRGDSDGGKGR